MSGLVASSNTDIVRHTSAELELAAILAAHGGTPSGGGLSRSSRDLRAAVSRRSRPPMYAVSSRRTPCSHQGRRRIIVSSSSLISPEAILRLAAQLLSRMTAHVATRRGLARARPALTRFSPLGATISCSVRLCLRRVIYDGCGIRRSSEPPAASPSSDQAIGMRSSSFVGIDLWSAARRAEDVASAPSCNEGGTRGGSWGSSVMAWCPAPRWLRHHIPGRPPFTRRWPFCGARGCLRYRQRHRHTQPPV